MGSKQAGCLRGLPFIEGSGTLLLEHGEGAVGSAAVLAQDRVHVSRLHHIHRGGDDSGAEARPKGGSEVAWEVICEGEGQLRVSGHQGREQLKKAHRGPVVFKRQKSWLEELLRTESFHQWSLRASTGELGARLLA